MNDITAGSGEGASLWNCLFSTCQLNLTIEERMYIKKNGWDISMWPYTIYTAHYWTVINDMARKYSHVYAGWQWFGMRLLSSIGSEY